MPKIVEWRGVSGLVAAPVLEDSTERFTTGDVIEIAGTSQISKSVDSQNATHYYDNNPAIVISATGADTCTIDVSAIPYDVLAKITGQSYDASKGLFIERERDPGSWALGYKTKKTDGTEVYVWRQKGTFAIPDETNQTENDGTDANGQQLIYTGVATTHRYTLEDGKLHAVRAVVVDTSVNAVDETTFFASVQTPDTISGAPAVAGIGVAPASLSIAEGGKATLSATLYPAGAVGTITWASDDTAVATVDADTGEVTAVAAGSANITATCGTYSDSCAVTVTSL